MNFLLGACQTPCHILNLIGMTLSVTFNLYTFQVKKETGYMDFSYT